MEDTNDMNKNNSSAWNGVTIEELKYMRAIALVKLEMQKELLKKKASKTIPMGSASTQNIIGNLKTVCPILSVCFLYRRLISLKISLDYFFICHSSTPIPNSRI